MLRRKIISEILPLYKYGYFFRLVEIEDADFIVSLRTDKRLSRFISRTSSIIEDQVKWIEEYKKRESNGEEIYIICLDSNEKRLGVNRLYNIKENEFEVGSWLYDQEKNDAAAVIGDLFSRSLAFEVLKLRKCKFNVRKNNKSVLRYHYFFKPKLVSEDNENYYFELDYDTFKKTRNKILKIFNHD